MVYIDDWETFYNESEKLYTENPAQVRQCLLAHSNPASKPRAPMTAGP